MDENAIEKAVTYLKANDEHEDGLEGEIARELLRFQYQITKTLHAAHYALLRSASVEGRSNHHGPWNEGGYGYEADKAVSKLLKELTGNPYSMVQPKGGKHVDNTG